MSYDLSAKDYDKNLDLKNLRAYGDTMNDAKVQFSFTLPVFDDERGIEAAKRLCKKMGAQEPEVVCHKPLDQNFTFYILYGAVSHAVNYEEITVVKPARETMDMHEVDEFIKEKLGRKVTVIGASTGSDAHTVGIDAIMNRKGFGGHYGLERYEMIEALNMGSQVPNEELVKKAVELNADVLLISQTVTQKDVHVKNLTELIELLEAEGLRERFIVACGGARISHELAKELGFDAGFGSGSFAEDVATFFAWELYHRATGGA